MYGRKLIVQLAYEINAEYGKGYGKSNLYQYVKFYRLFLGIFHGNRGKSPGFTWTHYRHFLRVEDPEARAWYEKEAIEQSWAEGTLDRNIATQYYYRMLMSADKNKPSVEGEMFEKTAEFQNDKLEFVKNPVIAEFLGLMDNNAPGPAQSVGGYTAKVGVPDDAPRLPRDRRRALRRGGRASHLRVHSLDCRVPGFLIGSSCKALTEADAVCKKRKTLQKSKNIAKQENGETGWPWSGKSRTPSRRASARPLSSWQGGT